MLRCRGAIAIRRQARVDVAERESLAGQVTLAHARGRDAISIDLARLITVEPEATAKPQTC